MTGLNPTIFARVRVPTSADFSHVQKVPQPRVDQRNPWVWMKTFPLVDRVQLGIGAFRTDWMNFAPYVTDLLNGHSGLGVRG
jgi:hypothetical protein